MSCPFEHFKLFNAPIIPQVDNTLHPQNEVENSLRVNYSLKVDYSLSVFFTWVNYSLQRVDRFQGQGEERLSKPSQPAVPDKLRSSWLGRRCSRAANSKAWNFARSKAQLDAQLDALFMECLAAIWK